MNDLKPRWTSVMKRCQSLARREHGGCTVLSLKILADEDGSPLAWTVTKTVLEPKTGGLQRLLEIMTEL